MKKQIHGWITRDEDGHLHFFIAKPCRIENSKSGTQSLPSIWANSPNEDGYELPGRMYYPEVKWEDEPKKATLKVDLGWTNEEMSLGMEMLLKVSAIQKRVDSGEITDIDGLRLSLDVMKESFGL